VSRRHPVIYRFVIDVTVTDIRGATTEVGTVGG